MQHTFGDWYPVSDEQLERFITEGTIAIDANVLLTLYRVNSDERQEILDALRMVEDRLFVPYHVAEEFHRNRLQEISDQLTYYNEVANSARKEIDAPIAAAIDAINAIRAPLDDLRDKTLKAEIETEIKRAEKRILKAFAKSVNKIVRRTESIRDSHLLSLEVGRKADPVLAELDKIVTAGRLGQRPSDVQLKTQSAEADLRFAAKIPPGYMDAKKDKNAFGDYFAWCELLDVAKASNRPLLWVSNDQKKDWYQEVSGQKVGPLPELRAEFRSATGQEYHHTPLYGFLTMLNTYFSAGVAKETIRSAQIQSDVDRFAESETEMKVSDIRVLVDRQGYVKPFVMLNDRSAHRMVAVPYEYDEILRLGVLIGDSVQCIQLASRDVRILGPIVDVRDGTECHFEMPTECPRCGSALTVGSLVKIGTTYRCENLSCPSRRSPEGSGSVKVTSLTWRAPNEPGDAP
ncbi:PIN-like domain-containing protein [Prescottella equi]|uniref:PIN like domain-containing protein n=1 Tax=Prescottella equi ATCC 33707 TaxID=525370 RepID=E9T0K6_RHOHA|nr:PIN-like domain-containing protein [Prescottella equi]EGD23957.1 hypothetical protein HMPREF0724_12165 [Prescottella equi ATCC 33707]